MGVEVWICVLALIVFIYRHTTRNFNYWKRQNVPYLPPVPIFGNIFNVIAVQKSIGQCVHEVYNYTESKFTGFFIFDQPFLLIRDPCLISNIFIKDFEYFDGRSVAVNEHMDQLGAKLLFNLKNPEWKDVRVKLTPIFSSWKLKSMLDLILTVSEELEAYIKEQIVCSDGIIESKGMCLKYSTDVISSCAFGIDSQSFKSVNAEFLTAARKLLHFTISRTIQFGSFFIAPCLVKLFKMHFLEPSAVKFLQSTFWEQMNHRKESKINRGDLLDILLQMKAEGTCLDDDVIVAQALQFFLAGSDAIKSSVLFTLYELAAHNEIQIQLRDQIKDVLKIHGNITYEAIMEMKYLDNVISESLRKYPPFTFLDRRCNKTYTIPNSNVTIQKGMPIYISLLGLHLDPVHFPDPDKFNPDRFSEKNKSLIKPYTYMPFGEGPRSCIGLRFGLLAAKVAIINVINNFEITLDSRTPYPISFDPKSAFLTNPKGDALYLRYKQIT